SEFRPGYQHAKLFPARQDRWPTKFRKEKEEKQKEKVSSRALSLQQLLNFRKLALHVFNISPKGRIFIFKPSDLIAQIIGLGMAHRAGFYDGLQHRAEQTGEFCSLASRIGIGYHGPRKHCFNYLGDHAH